MQPRVRNRRERALVRREEQLERYQAGDFLDSKGTPLWRAGTESEPRIIKLAEQEIAVLKQKLHR
jgi:hypothetical protein